MDNPKLGKQKASKKYIGEKVGQVEAVFGQYWRLRHAVNSIMI